SLSDAGFEFLADQLRGEGPLRDRLAAAEAVGRSSLSVRQLQRAAALAASCGPLELSWLLRAFEHDANRETGLLLVESLAKSPGLDGVPGERVREVFK